MRHDLPAIAKAAQRSRAAIEESVSRFARVHRYSVGTDLRNAAREVVRRTFLARHYGGHENDGSSMRAPMHTVTARDHHSLVHAFLVKYYGTQQDPKLRQPLGTITTKDRFGLVTVHGEPYAIVDIGMRMLSARELYRAQGFHDHYVIDPEFDGKRLTKEAQIRCCGNSVSPPVAEALVRSNVVEQREEAAA